MIAMLRTDTGTTKQEKDEARARILGKLIAHGTVKGSWDEIQDELDLADISRALFKRSCWHLRVGDRDPEGRPRIEVVRDIDEDRTSLYESAPFIITTLTW